MFLNLAVRDASNARGVNAVSAASRSCFKLACERVRVRVRECARERKKESEKESV